MKRVLGYAMLALLATPLCLQGQIRLGISGGAGNFTGDDFEGSQTGWTVGGELVYPLASGLEIGGLFDYSSYGVDDVDTVDANVMDIYGVARYPFPGERARFFVGAKGGYSRLSADSEGQSLSASGFAVGPTVGVRIPLSRISIDIAGDGMYTSYGDAEFEGTTIEDSSSSGFRWIARAGISIPLGS
jgi:hypothetical protein